MSSSVGITDNSHNSAAARPIHPLPKRRLRSRLSEDANAALFAPPQQPTTPLFYFPYNNYAGDAALGGTGTPAGFASGQDNLQDSSDEEDNSGISVSRAVGNGVSGAVENGSGPADPYEWTENTNNKKKRKIPTHTNPGGSTGGSGMGGSYSTTIHSSPGYSPTSTSTPRSRWKSSGGPHRSPLSTISSTNHASLRRASRRYTASPSTVDSPSRRWSGKASGDEPGTPAKAGRQDSGEPSGVPKQNQFTFVCESPVSANLAYNQGTGVGSGGSATDRTAYPKSVTTGTQTSPNMSNNAPYPSTQSAKKKGNRSRRDYAPMLQRRRRQEAAAHGNNNGEIWICEFCEYESIFGEFPEALMRQYEIKDRKERRRLAEKRRLLEKAKQKNKKNTGKNTGKKGGNSAAAPPPPADGQGTQSDSTPLASATPTPNAKSQRHSQQVQTDACPEGKSHHVSNGRGASTKGGSVGSAGSGESSASSVS